MRYTLKELVSRILESMDSDEVNTISQTTESLAVANIVKECYYDIISKLDLPEHKGIFQLDASGDNLKPVLMSLPSNALDIQYLKYNSNTTSDPVWYDLTYLPLEDFVNMQTTFRTDNTDVGSMTVNYNTGSFKFKFLTDRVPTYFTTLNDRDIVFDSYDSDDDTTLQKVKTFAYGGILPTFQMTDTYVPDLDARQFQLLLQDAKSQAFVELKQVPNPVAERKVRKNEILAQRTKDAIDQRPAIFKDGVRMGRK